MNITPLRQQIFAATLFFVSGAGALTYQVLWFKRFSHVWGSSGLALGAVLASFLLGLGLGAHCFGKWSNRQLRPLFWYGLCELAIGAIALGIALVLGALSDAANFLYSLANDQPLVQMALQCFVTFAILAIPCFLMGGTLPLLVRHFVLHESSESTATGLLYGLNTVGGAAGCLVTGFYFLPLLGLEWTNSLAATASIVPGLLAIAWALKASSPVVSTSADPVLSQAATGAAARDMSPGSVAILCIVALLTGFGSLALEIMWTRQLTLIVGGSTYAFAAMLFVILLGIGCGSLAFHLWLRPLGHQPLVAILTILAIITTATFSTRLIPQLTNIVALLAPLRTTQAMNAATCVAASAALEGLPALGMGILFPWIVEAARRITGNVGRSVGDIYALNTFGAICGAIVGSLMLLPALGAIGGTRIALVCYLAAMVLLAAGHLGRTPYALATPCLVAAAAIFWLTDSVDPRISNAGMFLYGYQSRGLLDEKLLHFQEGVSCNVLITEDADGQRLLRLNGKIDAGTGHDMNMQLGLAYFPLFLRPHSREALVIGFGSGTTPGAALLFPELRVTCCEIEPAVFAAARNFAEVNHSPQLSNRLNMVFDDGRAFLQGTTQAYDLILSEPSNPWLAGVANLFSVEFYEAARARLRSGGLLAQWIQIYDLTPADYAMVVRTISRVFPHVGLLRISQNDTILLASEADLSVGIDVLNDAQRRVESSPDIRSDLEKHFGTNDVKSVLVQHFLLPNHGVLQLADAGDSQVVNTDVNLRLEFDAPLRLFERDRSGKDAPQRSPGVAAVDARILQAIDPSWIEEQWNTWKCGKRQVSALHQLALLLLSVDRGEAAMLVVELGLQHDPEQPLLLFDQLTLIPSADKLRFQRVLETITRVSPVEAARGAVVLWRQGRFAHAAQVYRRLAELEPTSATAWINLAVSLRSAGQPEEASQAFEKARSLDLLNEFVIQAQHQFHR